MMNNLIIQSPQIGDRVFRDDGIFIKFLGFISAELVTWHPQETGPQLFTARVNVFKNGVRQETRQFKIEKLVLSEKNTGREWLVIEDESKKGEAGAISRTDPKLSQGYSFIAT